MPLSFHSLSHGTVAFGFYNIETDGLLLERHFFFCTDFCAAVREMGTAPRGCAPASSMPGYVFEDPVQIGDLMGAIRGLRHEGYIGEIYRVWPFPEKRADFRQKIRGDSTRGQVEVILKRWARPVTIPLSADAGWAEVRIGPYGFSRSGFAQLLSYVWRGGYPTWEGYEQGCRPRCVDALEEVMKRVRTGAA